jgi:1-acyl-sn-glycerol-3-phosphate acyltransferase
MGKQDPVKDWKPLPDWFKNGFAKTISFIFPHKRIVDMNKLETSRVLFVCNHQVGAIEVPLLFAMIYLETGLLPRGLADRFHFYIPIYRNFIWALGAILGDREMCRKVMQDGQPLLVFPGGADEVMRSAKYPKYTLMWGERKGFAKLALENGYTIVPVTSMGSEDMFFTLFDLPVRLVMRLFNDKRSQKNIVLPILVPSLNFQKQYFRFGKQIETKDLEYHEDNVTMIRDLTKVELLDGFEVIKRTRDQDPHRYLSWRYMLGQRL